MSTVSTMTQFVGDESRLTNRIAMSRRLTPEFHDMERERIFRRSWLVAASTTDLMKNGSYITTDIPPLKTSVLIVRGQDGQIRAFYNVCRHRGDKLVQTPAGCKKVFTCGFHAWSYSNVGRLLMMTDADQFGVVNKDDYGLVPIHCEVWEDLVFICFDKQPRETLREFLGEIYDQYSGFAAKRVKIAEHYLELKTNWNLATNAFQEGYHNLYLHKHTVPDYQGSPQNPNRHRPYLEVGRHFGRYAAHANVNHVQTKVEHIVFGHSKPMYPTFQKVDPATLPPGINTSQFEDWAFDIVHIFPNVIFCPQANTHSYLSFWPIEFDKTEIRNWRFAFGSDNPADAVAQAYQVTRALQVVREDMSTMESTFQGLRSGAIPTTLLSRQELLIQNHYRACDEMLDKE